MEGLAQILTSLGAAAPAGFNAYLSLLLVGIGGRVGWVNLASPYDLLQSNTALGLLTVLLTIELVADKIPALDSVNDIVGTVVRPVAGAMLFAGTSGEMNQLLALLLGGSAAGALHAFKAGTRPVWTLSTGGLANPVVSVFEDLVAGATVVLAMLVPFIGILVLLIVMGLVTWLLLRLRRGIRAGRRSSSAGALR